MGIYAIKPAFRRLLTPVAAAMTRSGVSADAVTTAGLAFAGLAGLGVWLGREGSAWLLLVPLAAFLRTAANAVDGMIATTTDTARPLGEVFNEVTDRLGDIAVFLPMALVVGVSAFLVAGVLAAMLVTSYLGVTVKAAGGSRIYSRGLTPTQAASVQLSVPVITAIGGVLLLSEAMSIRLVIASMLILGGIGFTLARTR